MPRILVIADDLTGAAEIGGIATRFGLNVQLLRTPAPPPVGCDVVVYDTDSRLLSAAAAAEKTATFTQAARAAAFDLVFKKTDSALRGEPFTETNAVAAKFNRTTILFIPHNPSRGRCIVDGRYHVHGVPLHQTEFARDPLHPAMTDDVVSLLRPAQSSDIRCVPAGASADEISIGWTIGEANSAEAVAEWAARFRPDHHLAAGGADFFDAILRRSNRGHSAQPATAVRRPLLYVSGTASTGSAALKESLASTGRLLVMPDAVFASGAAATGAVEQWAAEAAECLAVHGEAMIAIARANAADAGDPGKAEMLQHALAATTAAILEKSGVRTIACEGGATAATLCDRRGWRQFVLECEVAPGVAMLRSTASAPRLIVKPGSYAWPRV